MTSDKLNQVFPALLQQVPPPGIWLHQSVSELVSQPLWSPFQHFDHSYFSYCLIFFQWYGIILSENSLRYKLTLEGLHRTVFELFFELRFCQPFAVWPVTSHLSTYTCFPIVKWKLIATGKGVAKSVTVKSDMCLAKLVLWLKFITTDINQPLFLIHYSFQLINIISRSQQFFLPQWIEYLFCLFFFIIIIGI